MFVWDFPLISVGFFGSKRFIKMGFICMQIMFLECINVLGRELLLFTLHIYELRETQIKTTELSRGFANFE